MSCLLLLFVPQLCPGDLLNPNPIYQVEHSCTYSEVVHYSFSSSEPSLPSGKQSFQRFTMTWNFICLAVVLFHYFCIWKRESFLIEYLESDDDLPESNLKHILLKHLSIDSWFLHYNRVVVVTSAASVGFLLTNYIFSGVIIFRDFYNGFQSISVFMSYFLLISTLVWHGFGAAYEGLTTTRAFSSVETTPVEYNTIDPSHEHDDDAPIVTIEKPPVQVSAQPAQPNENSSLIEGQQTVLYQQLQEPV